MAYSTPDLLWLKSWSMECIMWVFVCVSVCVRVSVSVSVCIQGDSGGICTNLGYDSMSDSKQKFHTKMGPILNGYGVMTAWNLE